MTLLIMAAGNGSRYGALKQFDPLGPENEYLFEFSIYDAIENGFDHIVIVTKEQFVKDINEYLTNRLPGKIKIDVIAQRVGDLPSQINAEFDREKPWGTAHAVWAARKCIHNSFVVINADDYYGRDAFVKSFELMSSNKSGKLFGLVPYTLKDTLSDHGSVSRGICKVEGDFLRGIKELTKIKQSGESIIDFDSNTPLTGDEFCSMNFWICDPSVFNLIESLFIKFLSKKTNIESGEMYIPLIIQHMIDDEIAKIKLTKPSSSWFGVTYADDKKNAQQVLKKLSMNKIYPSPLWRN